MDQSNRYADLSLKEADLIAGGRHILVAYKMAPKPGYGYLEPMSRSAPPMTSPEVLTRWSITSTKPPKTCALRTRWTCLTATSPTAA